jgi:hypothetical protein
MPAVIKNIALTDKPSGAGTSDVSITPDGGYALVRRDGEPNLAIFSLADGTRTDIPLPGQPTDLDLSADDVRHQIMHSLSNLSPRRAGDHRASPRNLLRRNATLYASLMNCCAERILCAGLTNPLHFAAGGCAASDHRIFIAENAAGLAPPTVNAQEECHAMDFNRRVP